jgi:hypothetical protein
MQNDDMNAFLSVSETLSLAAAFQLPSTVSVAQRANLVDAVVSEVNALSRDKLAVILKPPTLKAL